MSNQDSSSFSELSFQQNTAWSEMVGSMIHLITTSVQFMQNAAFNNNIQIEPRLTKLMNQFSLDANNFLINLNNFYRGSPVNQYPSRITPSKNTTNPQCCNCYSINSNDCGCLTNEEQRTPNCGSAGQKKAHGDGQTCIIIDCPVNIENTQEYQTTGNCYPCDIDQRSEFDESTQVCIIEEEITEISQYAIDPATKKIKISKVEEYSQQAKCKYLRHQGTQSCTGNEQINLAHTMRRPTEVEEIKNPKIPLIQHRTHLEEPNIVAQTVEDAKKPTEVSPAATTVDALIQTTPTGTSDIAIQTLDDTTTTGREASNLPQALPTTTTVPEEISLPQTVSQESIVSHKSTVSQTSTVPDKISSTEADSATNVPVQEDKADSLNSFGERSINLIDFSSLSNTQKSPSEIPSAPPKIDAPLETITEAPSTSSVNSTSSETNQNSSEAEFTLKTEDVSSDLSDSGRAIITEAVKKREITKLCKNPSNTSNTVTSDVTKYNKTEEKSQQSQKAQKAGKQQHERKSVSMGFEGNPLIQQPLGRKSSSVVNADQAPGQPQRRKNLPSDNKTRPIRVASNTSFLQFANRRSSSTKLIEDRRKLIGNSNHGFPRSKKVIERDNTVDPDDASNTSLLQSPNRTGFPTKVVEDRRKLIGNSYQRPLRSKKDMGNAYTEEVPEDTDDFNHRLFDPTEKYSAKSLQTKKRIDLKTANEAKVCTKSYNTENRQNKKLDNFKMISSESLARTKTEDIESLRQKKWDESRCRGSVLETKKIELPYSSRKFEQSHFFNPLPALFDSQREKASKSPRKTGIYDCTCAGSKSDHSSNGESQPRYSKASREKTLATMRTKIQDLTVALENTEVSRSTIQLESKRTTPKRSCGPAAASKPCGCGTPYSNNDSKTTQLGSLKAARSASAKTGGKSYQHGYNTPADCSCQQFSLMPRQAIKIQPDYLKTDSNDFRSRSLHTKTQPSKVLYCSCDPLSKFLR